jgi:CubicO group peptidase (beta-lactamase class C family)
MRIRRAVFLTVIFLPLSFALAQTTASLDSIPARMRDMIVANEVPGAVTVVATRDSVLRMNAQGWADPEHKSFMRVDSIFWIASMSKPITAIAVLMLMEDGKLSLDDPIAKYVPELAGLKTADGKTPRITIRHLLTHTSGMGEATDEESKTARTLSDLIPAFASKPLAFEAGSKWQYSQSGILTLGRIVEIVSGVPFEVFLRNHIFDPLGIKDTTFYLSEAQMPRWVIPARRESEQLVPAEIGLLNGHPPTWRGHYPASNGGLFSTAPDYTRLAQMLLTGGALDGRRYLTADSVRMMSTVVRLHTPLIEPDMRISRIRLSEKGSQCRPREIARALGKASEAQHFMQRCLREPFGRRPHQFVLGTQPLKQPLASVLLHRPIGRADWS